MPLKPFTQLIEWPSSLDDGEGDGEVEAAEDVGEGAGAIEGMSPERAMIFRGAGEGGVGVKEWVEEWVEGWVEEWVEGGEGEER